MNTPVVIDGSKGEGGGQMLRSSLALSLATGRPLSMRKIRAGRRKGGLLRQHLTCVEAAKRMGHAMVQGAELRSESLDFTPQGIAAGTYHLSVGTAGSTSLVVQAVLPAALLADGPTTLVVEGGTHASFAPSFDYLKYAFAPALRAMGATISMDIERYGFFPAGGGRITVVIEPPETWRSLELMERGQRTSVAARAYIANLHHQIAERELEVVRRELGWRKRDSHVIQATGSPGPGNTVVLQIDHEHVSEVFESHGKVDLPAERVAKTACRQARRWMKLDAPVGRHLADQLMLPMVLGAGGAFRTVGLTPHSKTNIEVIHAFLGPRIAVEACDDGSTLVRVAPPMNAR